MAYLPTFNKIGGVLGEEEDNNLVRQGDVAQGVPMAGGGGVASPRPSAALPMQQQQEVKAPSRTMAQSLNAAAEKSKAAAMPQQAIQQPIQPLRMPEVIAQQAQIPQPVIPPPPAPAAPVAAELPPVIQNQSRPGVVMLGGGTPTMTVGTSSRGSTGMEDTGDILSRINARFKAQSTRRKR